MLLILHINIGLEVQAVDGLIKLPLHANLPRYLFYLQGALNWKLNFPEFHWGLAHGILLKFLMNYHFVIVENLIGIIA
jgi:hypothetical protein